ncbi:MAG: peptidoglycan-binding protein [Clostridia bacterium]|nr:peptidoglycan-binding protein [Clostridia bacterium]
MKKLLLTLALLLALTLPALAEPMVAADGYTAWLGENSHMYLLDPAGATKVLRYPIADIHGIADGSVYVLAQDGREFAIRLDGSQTIELSAGQSGADIVAAPFVLADGALYALRADGSRQLLATSVTAAAANTDRIFFITQTITGVTSLKALTRDSIAGTNTTILPTLLGMGVEDAASMTASEDALGVIAADGSITVISLIDMSRSTHPATSADTARVVCIGTDVLRYARNEQGWWLLQADTDLPTLTLVDPSVSTAANREPGSSYVSTATPTATLRPIATPSPTPTRRATATPKPTATPTPEEAYPRLEYGDRGTAVRNLQRRLNALGYPVGKVDGVWGENTQLAVNLFQCALGWTERDYASSAMQEKLYSRSAPQYDPYSPLREGDKGTDVKLMQKALFDLGYLGTDEEEEVDGKYGPITTQAIIAFQAAAGYMLEDTGYADADTLFLLFSDAAPRNPALSAPTDPNYPEFIVPDTPPATDTDLVIWIEPRS